MNRVVIEKNFMIKLFGYQDKLSELLDIRSGMDDSEVDSDLNNSINFCIKVINLFKNYFLHDIPLPYGLWHEIDDFEDKSKYF